MGVVNGIIYAIGGYDGSAHLNTVECFDPMTNAWKPVASMASRRSSAGVAVLNDMLYVVGELMLKMVANDEIYNYFNIHSGTMSVWLLVKITYIWLFCHKSFPYLDQGLSDF